MGTRRPIGGLEALSKRINVAWNGSGCTDPHGKIGKLVWKEGE